MPSYSAGIQLLPQTVWGRILVGCLIVLGLVAAFFLLTLVLVAAGMLIAIAAVRALWKGDRRTARGAQTIIEGEYSREDHSGPSAAPRLPNLEMSFEEFLAKAPAMNAWSLDKNGAALDFPAERVLEELQKAFDARDAGRAEDLLALATVRPRPEYGPIVCRFVENGALFPMGWEELALEALKEVISPALLDDVVRILSRPGLAFDPTDWRKGLEAIEGLYARRLVDRPAWRQALKEIAGSGNALAPEAARRLATLQDSGE